MKDRRNPSRVLGSYESQAVAQYRQHQAACLAEILLARCGVKVLREEAKAAADLPAPDAR